MRGVNLVLDATELTQHAATTGLIAKAAVDLYRKSPIPSPAFMLPTIALAFGIGGNFAVAWYESVTLDARGIFMTTLVGFLGAAVAVVATEIHDWARKGE